MPCQTPRPAGIPLLTRPDEVDIITVGLSETSARGRILNRKREAINNHNNRFGGKSNDTVRINNRISAATVRLIDSDGTQIGIKSINEALALARTRGMDLIEIAPQANPPVCKVLDYSKYRYEQEKKERESHRNQKAGFLKEVRIKPHIGQHDLDVKIKHMTEFLTARDKVRITVVFRGREMAHQDLGRKLLLSIQERLAEVASVEQSPLSDRNRMSMTLIPKR
ncbi:MAG: translation initiation factor IF-3 [Elusimicrobia bacterium]|nr:translation initiation factor IF-3 [Elusimicrobiota bacterium]